MSSIRRLISSRLNGAKSTGPKTAAGKLRSSRNALRHGCRSSQFRDTLLPGESQEQFDQLLQDHISSLHPSNEAEHAAIRRMVFARWRARRLQALENSMWNEVLRAQAEPDLISSYEILSQNPRWTSISRHENACDLAYFRELRQFLRPKTQNRTNEPTLSFPYAQPTMPEVSPVHSLCRPRRGRLRPRPQSRQPAVAVVRLKERLRSGRTDP